MPSGTSFSAVFPSGNTDPKNLAGRTSHRANHAAIGFVGTALEQFDFARASSVPANMLPIMIEYAPAAIALAISPE